jgi:N-acetylglucosamine kinase-like BadF-type ATPase
LVIYKIKLCSVLKETRSPKMLLEKNGEDSILLDRPYVLGIDGGGTKTTCVLLDKTGQVWGRGQGGSANYQTVGTEAAYRAIELAIGQATRKFEVLIQGIGIGLAGVGRAADQAIVRGWIDRLQTSPQLSLHWDLKPEDLKSERIAICADCEIALVGGIGQQTGIAAISGTGAIVWGRNQRGDTKRVGGWGYLLGDEGSGYWIARQGLQAVMRSFDGRLGDTHLTRHLVAHLGLNTVEDLIEVVYRQGWGVAEIAALSLLVDRAATEGDAMARQILDHAAQELILAVQVAANALFQSHETFEVVTLGGAWQSAYLRQTFVTSFTAIFPHLQVIEPRHEAAYGAALMVLG